MGAGDSLSNAKYNVRPAIVRVGLLLLIALCVVFVSSYTNRLARKAQVEREIDEVEQQIGDAQLHQLELQAELDYVQSAAYVEGVARNDLDMARPGDTVIIVMEPSAPPVQSEPSISQPADASLDTDLTAQPTWLQWLGLLAGED